MKLILISEWTINDKRIYNSKIITHMLYDQRVFLLWADGKYSVFPTLLGQPQRFPMNCIVLWLSFCTRPSLSCLRQSHALAVANLDAAVFLQSNINILIHFSHSNRVFPGQMPHARDSGDINFTICYISFLPALWVCKHSLVPAE